MILNKVLSFKKYDILTVCGFILNLVNIISTSRDQDEHSICNTDCKKLKISSVFWAVMSCFLLEV